MLKLFEEHIELVKSVNEAVGQDRLIADAFLHGFRKCARILLSEVPYGRMLCSADDYYRSIGVDRPMCCGVFLTKTNPVGVEGQRDPEYPCADFKPGKPSYLGRCDGDGHYLCDECVEHSTRLTAEAFDSASRDSVPVGGDGERS